MVDEHGRYRSLIAGSPKGPLERRFTDAWPDPNASRDDVGAFLLQRAPAPPPLHEAPQVENGPSPMCNACGLVRVNILAGPFCAGCTSQIAAAGSP